MRLVILIFPTSDDENQWLTSDTTAQYEIIGDSYPLPVFVGLGGGRTGVERQSRGKGADLAVESPQNRLSLQPIRHCQLVAEPPLPLAGKENPRATANSCASSCAPSWSPLRKAW